MKRFAELYLALDATTKTGKKVAALEAYFRAAPPEDAAWAAFFLTGRRLTRLLPSAVLAGAGLAVSGVPGWLMEACFHETGDFAETLALLVDTRLGGGTKSSGVPLHVWVEERLLPLRDAPPDEQERLLAGWFRELAKDELSLFTKLLTGEMRVGVSEKLVVRALAAIAGVPESVLAHRLMGNFEPTREGFAALVRPGGDDDEAPPVAASQPYPFFLATQLEEDPASLGARNEWQVEWKWDGIRAQLVRRQGEVFIWSRGEELVTDRFPEVVERARALPDGTVLDGELLAYRDGRPLSFGVLQRRIGRTKLTAKILEEAPVTFMAYDLLEEGGEDRRDLPLEERRARLEKLVAGAFPLSEVVRGSWEDLARLRETSRERGVEGFMLKRRASPYRTGRKRGDWWKWKIDPYTIDAVLIYAQPGHGRRATLYTDYTFGVWDEGKLTPVAKAYSGLSDAEIDECDAWIREHTLEKHGPVRVVEPHHVFEIAFEAILESKRHRSGIAVRFPRIKRWRRDKKADEADTLERVRALLAAKL